MQNYFSHIIETFIPTNESSTQQETIKLKPQSFNDQISAVDQLFYRAQNYQSSTEYIQAFEFVNKIRNLAPFNAWLLYIQNPDITYVATANDWAIKFNRAIQLKARAYVIMKAFGPVDFVYDALETIGDTELPKDIQSSFRAEGIIPEIVVKQILKCCNKKGIDVQYDNTLWERQAGWASHKQLASHRTIVINATHKPEIQFSTLIHELAHLLLGHLGKFLHCECEDRSYLDKNAKEIEAETVSWLICNRLRIITDADRYLHPHVQNKEALSEISVHKILTTSDRIENMIVSNLCKKEKTKN